MPPPTSNEFVTSAPSDKRSDGPLIQHPNQIADSSNLIDLRHLDTAMSDHRLTEKERRAHLVASKARLVEISEILVMPSAVDMGQLLRRHPDKDIERLVERWYVHTELYLQPGKYFSPSMVNMFKREWDMNAMGIYYRHYHSHHWQDPTHKLWIPSLADIEWDHASEATRRQKANVFLKHALDNEKWNKSEYVWEADAWSDVFRHLRDDPVVVANKHTYYATKEENHPVSCLLNGKTKKVYRTPDATFGLATYKPENYQNALACYELDHDRLDALMVHPSCGIISDPQLGNTNMAFPFAVYEAKGWSGDAREARHQACSAAAVYLDMLHDLGTAPEARDIVPELKKKIPHFVGPVYNEDGNKAQVFALTSFGSHWHILVGYRRRRTPEESGGTPGVSEHVYIFQRIWSARVVTERKAWELLSLIDQIHVWGVTEHRSHVVNLLKDWHEYCSEEFSDSADLLRSLPGLYQREEGKFTWSLPLYNLPSWAEHLGPGKRTSLKLRMATYVLDSYITRFRPHPVGHIEALLAQRERLKQDGEGIKAYNLPLDSSSPVVNDEMVQSSQHSNFGQTTSIGSTQRRLTLRPKGHQPVPGTLRLPIKRLLGDSDPKSSGMNRKRIKQ